MLLLMIVHCHLYNVLFASYNGLKIDCWLTLAYSTIQINQRHDYVSFNAWGNGYYITDVNYFIVKVTEQC